MNRIVTITGHKHPKKAILFDDLNKMNGVQFVKPYTDRELPHNSEKIHYEEYNYVLPAVMEDMLRDEKVICKTVVNGHRYVFFAFQMTEKVNVLFADDYGVVQIKENYDNVCTVRLVSNRDSDKTYRSERVGEYLYTHEFNFVFELDNYPKELNRLVRVIL